MNKKEKLEETIKVFDSLKLTNWSHSKQSVGGGGQATGLIVSNQKGDKGVFRLAHCNSQEAKDRFKREIKILTTDNFKHPNLIEILDFTKNTESEYWYISRLGETLHSYWNNFVEKEKDGDERVDKAINIILSLLKGLDLCHSNSPLIIHRDIKSKNIVLIDNVPMLIDFGIAYDDGEEDISPVDVAPANRRSSDMQLYRGADKIPWYDVYLMAQLLIWMICEEPLTTWERPLNWRFVVFPTNISKENVIKLKAIFAICSIPEISPKNASELTDFVEAVYFEKEIKTETMNFDTDKIKEAIAQGKSQLDLSKANDFEIFESLFPFFCKQCNRVREIFYDFEKELASVGTRFIEQEDLPSFASKVRKSLLGEQNLVLQNIFKLSIKETGFFQFQVYYFPDEFLKTRTELIGETLYDKFTVSLSFGGEYVDNGRKNFGKVLVFQKDGTIIIKDNSYNVQGKSSFDELKDDINEFLNDPDLWKYLK